jgi:hypothetical protein
MDTNVVYELIRVLAESKQGRGIDTQTLILILAAIAPTLAAIAAYIKANAAYVNSKAVHNEVKDVHVSINSRLDGWLEKAREDGVLGERREVAEAANAADAAKKAKGQV